MAVRAVEAWAALEAAGRWLEVWWTDTAVPASVAIQARAIASIMTVTNN
ncbi:MAG: hypothetical protein Q8J97_02695 [Flavobacteriaceae bacterium]|nr:hypothetical protein [Flavobacteriaceae bacterium]